MAYHKICSFLQLWKYMNAINSLTPHVYPLTMQFKMINHFEVQKLNDEIRDSVLYITTKSATLDFTPFNMP